MNLLRRCLLISAAAITTAVAGDPVATARTEVEIFQLPQPLALELVPRLLEDRTAAVAYADLQSACDRGKAEHAGTFLARGPAGKPSASQQIEPVRYGIEYELLDPRIDPRPQPGGPQHIPHGATTYEERDTGRTLKAQLNPEGHVQLSIGFTRLQDWFRYESSRHWNGNIHYVAQPAFLSRQVGTEIADTHGAPVLLGIFSMPERKGFWELHVATTSVHGPSAAVAPAEKPAAPAREWRVELQRFRLAQDEALPLRAKLLDPAETPAAHETLLRMVQKGVAELVDWSTLLTVDAHRAVSTNGQEVRYAIEFEQVQGGGGPGSEENPAAQAALLDSLNYLQFLSGGAPMDPPTTFETRNAGEALEVEPAFSNVDGGLMGMSLSAGHVQNDGFTRWASGPDYEGNSSFVFQPNFKVRRTSTNLWVTNGEWMLLQFSRLQDSSDQCELTLLRTRAPSPDSHP
jgi:hypothetical protein